MRISMVATYTIGIQLPPEKVLQVSLGGLTIF